MGEGCEASPAALRFPLYDCAQRLGVLDGHCAIITAPTPTGKSHIGREAIHRAIDAIRPEEAELIVATYECFAAVLQRSAFRPGTIVADEIHLIADHDRGPGVEGPFARLPPPSGEVLNMLGRAARPNQVEGGIALIRRDDRKHAEIEELIAAVEAGKGGDVESRLPESFEGIMRFFFATVVEAARPPARTSPLSMAAPSPTTVGASPSPSTAPSKRT